MDSVELFNCSQRDTYQSGIRFENLRGKTQVLNNSAIHGSQGWPMSFAFADNVYVDNTHIVGGSPMGVVAVTSNNITIANSLSADIVPREVLVTMGDVEDKEACWAICVVNGDTCNDWSLVNNIAAGCKYAGFVVPGHDCGEHETQI